jgi:hypothetical protein
MHHRGVLLLKSLMYCCRCPWGGCSLLPPAAAGPQKKEDECIPDKLFMALCLSLCVNTLVLGLHQVRRLAARGPVTTIVCVHCLHAEHMCPRVDTLCPTNAALTQ